MDRWELLEAASATSATCRIPLMAAGEDRLALDVGEIAEWLDFAKLPPKDMPPEQH
jgi:hypothetical protein